MNLNQHIKPIQSILFHNGISLWKGSGHLFLCSEFARTLCTRLESNEPTQPYRVCPYKRTATILHPIHFSIAQLNACLVKDDFVETHSSSPA